MEINDIIRRMQAEIDAANIKLIESQAEIARLTAVIESRHGTVAGLIGEVVKAEMGGEADIRSAALEAALQRIARWHGEFPETGRTWDDRTPMSYGAANGSNGERDYMRQVALDALAAAPAKAQGVATLADEDLRDAITIGLRGLYGCGRVWSAWGVGTMSEDDFYLADESDEAIEQVFDAITEEIGRLAAEVPPLPAPSKAAEGMVLAPHYRGYAKLGTGQYLLNHSRTGEETEFVISVATDAEKAGRVVGDERANASDALLQPESMAVRIAFANVGGLDAMENQLRKLRVEHFPESSYGARKAAVGVLTDEQREVLSFLDGSGPLDGMHFGDSDTSKPRARFWWRKNLREAFAAQVSGQSGEVA